VPILLTALMFSIAATSNDQATQPLLSKLAHTKQETRLRIFKDVPHSVLMWPPPLTTPLTLSTNGKVKPDESIKPHLRNYESRWVVGDRGIEINGEFFAFNPQTQSFFKPEYPGATFGDHLLLPLGAEQWATKRQAHLHEPKTRLEILHFSMSKGGGHDTILGLVEIGNSTSIPFLIGFLDRWQKCESTSIPDYIEHCIEALKRISGKSYGLCAKDWADGLQLSLEECRRTIGVGGAV